VTTSIKRGEFLKRAAVGGAGVISLGALERLTARQALAAGGRPVTPADGYGALAPVADQRGREILALPAGFAYVTFGEIGDPMSDGRRTPIALDGMAAFAGHRRDTVRLIRNHEDRNAPGAGSIAPSPKRAYDPSAGGGTTTIDFDLASRRIIRDFVSLEGTIVNCAGGIGFGKTAWITGEEVVSGPEHTVAASRFPVRHGYCFEVPVSRGAGKPRRAEPLVPLGRFAHEAVAVDQRTGVVYETEDPGSGVGAGFYRFLPDDPRRLARGGSLQMLGIKGRPGVDLRKGQHIGQPLEVVWFDIADPDPDYEVNNDPRSVFNQGYGQGGALFNRLEGCWEDEGTIYFVSTSGGDAENGDVNSDGYKEGFGQVWEYRPSSRNGGRLTLVFESPEGAVLDSPDNLTVTPRGGLLLCEDDASSDSDIVGDLAPGITDVNRLIGLTPGGDPFPFAVNRLNDSEFAGACFSPDGSTLFVNILGGTRGTIDELAGTGMTCAITGPWADGPL
jgi:uncharacterized protein